MEANYMLTRFFSHVFLVTLLISTCISANSVFHIGAILDEESAVGKEQIVAMRIAVQAFNNQSDTLKLNITFKNPSMDVLSSANAAKELIKESKVKAIIGMNQWVDAAAIAEIGSKANIPIISFSEPAFKSEFTRIHWPFMVSMATDDAEQMKCISAIIRSYNWKRIVAVYEENLLGGSSGKLALLAEELQVFDAEIEYNLALPPFYTLSSPESTIKQALEKLPGIKSRVFVVLQMSLPVVVRLFEAANYMGLMEPNTVWIVTDSVANYLDMVNTSVICSMEGLLGVRNYYSTNTADYHNFRKVFRRAMLSEYPDGETLVPGINALRAYDALTTITQALKKYSRSFNGSHDLLTAISSTDFAGRSGRIKFQRGRLSNNALFRVVNVVGKSYKELDFWLPGYGFSRNHTATNSDANTEKLSSHVIWPGDSQSDPKGWAMPTSEKKMKIVVPGATVFDRFVRVVDARNNKYEGFCIDLFNRALHKLDYPVDFFLLEPRNGTYTELVNMVYNKTYDGVVGDVTMLAERLDKVQFTSSYLDSGLSMIVPAVSDSSAWIFLKPFTLWMWMVSGVSLIYTTFAVWFMERQNSPELGDDLKEQIGNAVMFTLSSLFFVQREKLYNHLTRVVLIVWLFLVLVLNSSYTASLSSMLTTRKLRPSITDIRYLVKHDLKVACDPHSFLYSYLQNVHRIKPANMINITSYDNVRDQILSGNIAAAFMETPYKNAFFNQFCGKEFAETTYNYRFGGLAFAFEKGSPFAMEISKALLQLQEEGSAKQIEDQWFSPSDNCGNDLNYGNLDLQSFWALFLLCGATSTACLLIFSITKVVKYRKHIRKIRNERMCSQKSEKSAWEKTKRFASFLYYGEEADPPSSNRENACYSEASELDVVVESTS